MSLSLQRPRGKAWETPTFLANWKTIEVPYSVLQAVIPVITGSNWSYTTQEDVHSGALQPGNVPVTIGVSPPGFVSQLVDAAMTAAGTMVYMSLNGQVISLNYGSPLSTTTTLKNHAPGDQPNEYHGYFFASINTAANTQGMMLFWKAPGIIGSYRAHGTTILTGTAAGESIPFANIGTWTCTRTGGSTPAYNVSRGRIYVFMASSTNGTICRYWENTAFSAPTGLSFSSIPCYPLGWQDPNLDEYYMLTWGPPPNLSIVRYQHGAVSSVGYDIAGPVTSPSAWLCRCGLFRVGNIVVGFYPTTTGIVRVSFGMSGTGLSATPILPAKVDYITTPTPMVDIRQVSYGFFADFNGSWRFSKDGFKWEQHPSNTLCVEAGGITVANNGFTSVVNHPGVYKGVVTYL